MSTHSYSLRNRLASTAASNKTPTNSPHTKQSSRSPRKPSTHTVALQLKHVIGTTTTTPSGLTSCEVTKSFAYCAGAVAVLAEISSAGSISYRYFKARPTVVAVNAASSHYDPPSNNNTPTRRASAFPTRKGIEDSQSRGFGRDWLDESAGSTWSARERIKAATCVSLSPDGRLLAVGETGYNPRVLLFSTSAASSTEIPLSIITEHSIGVRSVAFSPDSRYLATLGDVNDGFLYIWAVNTKNGEIKLQSTNKCTTNVYDMTWCGNNVITVGTRHVKIWQVTATPRTSPQKRVRLGVESEQNPSPGPVPLQGRNCLLGKMVDATFTSVTSVSPEHAVVCADDGSVCVIDLSYSNVALSQPQRTDNSTIAISYYCHEQRLVWSNGGKLQQQDINSLVYSTGQGPEGSNDDGNGLRPRTSKHSLRRESLSLAQSKRAKVIALACLADVAISINAKGLISCQTLTNTDIRLDIDKLSAHCDIIRGIQELSEAAGLGSFFTWARDGEVRFWSTEGTVLRVERCDLDQIFDEDNNETNELRVVRYTAKQSRFITGDRYGVVRLVDQDSWVVRQTIRAHGADITSLAIHDNLSMLATCSRDRMVQLFQIGESGLILLQTSDEHISAVHHVLFSDDGHRLLSCSADRTIVVRERIERESNGSIIAAYLPARVITLKGSPLSMSLLKNDQNLLFVSTMDRFVVKVDVNTGALVGNFKVSDRDTDETATLNSICSSISTTADQLSILVGFSSIDKSIRVYDMQRGVLLGRDAGHTEGISDMVLLDGEGKHISMNRTIVSTGLDSTIMIWSVTASSQPLLTSTQDSLQSQAASLCESDSTPSKTTPVSLPPLRKVLTKMDVAEFTRQSSPTRESSPHAIKKKTSRLAMSASIEEINENMSPSTIRGAVTGRQATHQQRSPSPPATYLMKPRKQRSKPEFGSELDTKRSERSRLSPSSPTMPTSAPTTPKHVRANNGRLRRLPSIPSDLRTQATTPQQRQSMVVSTDGGSIAAASEATCRMLRTYRKKLQSNRGNIDLDHVENELEAVLNVIRRRKEQMIETKKGNENHVTIGRGSNEIDELTALLGRTSMDKSNQDDTHSTS